MMRVFGLGRVAWIGVAVALFLLLSTLWYTTDSFSDSWNLPYCAPREQRPCPLPPAPTDLPTSPADPSETKTIISSPPIPTSRLHYLIPASNSQDGACVGIASALLNRYPAPVIVGWKAEGKFNAKGNHLAKLHGISRYLHNVEDAEDDDLVIVVDAFDIIAQVPAEATLHLYFDMMRAANDRLAARHGMSLDEARANGLYQSLLWGAEKGCFPPQFHEAQCWLVPESDAPHNQWGPRAVTDRNDYIWRFPRALNSGAVIGPLRELRDFIDATLTLIDQTFDPEFHYSNSDQLYIARLYARQEYHRNLNLVPRDRPYPGLNNGKDRTLPKPRANDSDVTEYHVTVDFEYAFAQHHCYNERFMHRLQYNNWDKTTTVSKDHLDEGDGFRPYHIQMPAYIYKALAHVWKAIDDDEKPKSTALEWVQDLHMNTNVATRKIFAFYHSTCVKKGFIDRFHDYWFFPYIDLLLRTAAKENRKGTPISSRPIDGRMWISANKHPEADEEEEQDLEGYGGVFTDNVEETYLTYREVCGEHWDTVFKKEEKEEEHKEEHKEEENKQEENTQEKSKQGESKLEESKLEDSKQEEGKQEESKQEESKQEENKEEKEEKEEQDTS